MNSSVIYWNGDYSFLYKEFVQNQKFIESKYAHAEVIGDQGFYKDTMDNMRAFDDFVRPGFFGWCHHKAGKHINDPSILVFTSTEKPTNNMDLDLVKNNWI